MYVRFFSNITCPVNIVVLDVNIKKITVVVTLRDFRFHKDRARTSPLKVTARTSEVIQKGQRLVTIYVCSMKVCFDLIALIPNFLLMLGTQEFIMVHVDTISSRY